MSATRFQNLNEIFGKIRSSVQLQRQNC